MLVWKVFMIRAQIILGWNMTQIRLGINFIFKFRLKLSWYETWPCALRGTGALRRAKRERVPRSRMMPLASAKKYSGEEDSELQGICRQGIGSFVRNSYVSTLRPVVLCPDLCTPERHAGRLAFRAPDRGAERGACGWVLRRRLARKECCVLFLQKSPENSGCLREYLI